MKIIIFGASGQLGLELQNAFNETSFNIHSFSKKDVDITDSVAVKKILKEINPDVVINCAAYTKVDDAEVYKSIAKTVNFQGTKIIASNVDQKKTTLIHISTDYVFDGNKKNGYKENDKTNPINTYGISKLFGEDIIKETLENYIIIRTSWVFSNFGNNFFKTMLDNSSKDSLDVIDDQFGCPTSTSSISKLLIKICYLLKDGKNIKGTYHFCNYPPVNWYEFAKKIFSIAKNKGVIDSAPALNSIKSEHYALKAKRPKTQSS